MCAAWDTAHQAGHTTKEIESNFPLGLLFRKFLKLPMTDLKFKLEFSFYHLSPDSKWDILVKDVTVLCTVLSVCNI